MRANRDNQYSTSRIKTAVEPVVQQVFAGGGGELFSKYQNASKDTALGAINEQYWTDYVNNIIPIESAMIDRMNNVNTVGDAEKDAVTARRILGDMTDRNRARYGMNVKPRTSAYEDRMQQLGQVRGVAKAKADARIADEETKLSIMSDLAAQGATLRNNSQQGLGTAAGLQAGRDAQYQASKTAASAQKTSLISTGLGMLAMTFL